MNVYYKIFLCLSSFLDNRVSKYNMQRCGSFLCNMGTREFQISHNCLYPSFLHISFSWNTQYLCRKISVFYNMHRRSSSHLGISTNTQDLFQRSRLYKEDSKVLLFFLRLLCKLILLYRPLCRMPTSNMQDRSLDHHRTYSQLQWVHWQRRRLIQILVYCCHRYWMGEVNSAQLQHLHLRWSDSLITNRDALGLYLPWFENHVASNYLGLFSWVQLALWADLPNHWVSWNLDRNDYSFATLLGYLQPKDLRQQCQPQNLHFQCLREHFLSPWSVYHSQSSITQTNSSDFRPWMC